MIAGIFSAAAKKLLLRSNVQQQTERSVNKMYMVCDSTLYWSF